MPIQHWSDKIWVVKLSDEPAFSEDLSWLRSELGKTRPTPDIVVDLANVRQINSSNLSHILQVRKMVVDGDARLRLAAPQNAVWAVFLTTGLDKVFEFRSDVTTALASLQLEQ